MFVCISKFRRATGNEQRAPPFSHFHFPSLILHFSEWLRTEGTVRDQYSWTSAFDLLSATPLPRRQQLWSPSTGNRWGEWLRAQWSEVCAVTLHSRCQNLKGFKQGIDGGKNSMLTTFWCVNWVKLGFYEFLREFQSFSIGGFLWVDPI